MVIPWSDRPDCNALCDLEASTMNGFDTFFFVTFCLSLRIFFGIAGRPHQQLVVFW